MRLEHNNCIFGKGLVAGKAYQSGELIFRLSNYSIQDKATHKTIQISKDKHIENLDILANLNNSCRPNTVFDVESLTLIAINNIAYGEEMTFFYPSTEWILERPFACHCGFPECVGFVTGAKFLTSDILQRYFINPHIWELYNMLISCSIS